MNVKRAYWGFQLLGLALHLPLGCRMHAAEGTSPAQPAPARVEHGIAETDLATVTLTPQAQARLGVRTAAMELRVVPGALHYAGETVAPLAAPGAGPTPMWSGSLEALLQIATAQNESDGRVRQAQVQRDAARLTYDRAKTLRGADAGSVQALELAHERLQLAEAALQTALDARTLLGDPVPTHALTPRLWVRIKVFAGDQARLERHAPATIRPLADRTGQAVLTAARVAGPLTADAATGTVDWFYQLESFPPDLHTGERVSVSILMAKSVESLVIPFQAVIHDFQGGQWVYEMLAPNTFTRRRVWVERVAGEDAILAEGPPVGTSVVVVGVTELFGAEFGIGK